MVERPDGHNQPLEWKPPQAPGAPPPPPAPERPGDAPPASSQPPYSPPASGPYPPERQRVPGKATAALVLGILGLIVLPIVCSLLAVVFGNQARREIDSDPALGGRGLATAGFVLGIIGLVFFGLIILAFALSA